ncbi:hypothetical protein AMTRI_Chr08g164080 [Amborella trichopoda]
MAGLPASNPSHTPSFSLYLHPLPLSLSKSHEIKNHSLSRSKTR